MPLPERLPDGAFVVLTHREGVGPPRVAPGSSTEVRTLSLSAARTNEGVAHQLQDVLAYVYDRVTRDRAVNAAIHRAQPPVTLDEAAEVLAVASEGNFVYLVFLLQDLAEDAVPSLDSTALPRGLSAYYQTMWAHMLPHTDAPDRAWDLWARLRRPVLERLAVAAEPVTLEWLGDHTNQPPNDIHRRALDAWARFVPHIDEDPPRWRIIHQSFREFLRSTDDIDVDGAHGAVAGYYLADPQRWDAHEGYALRHLAAHLRAARDHARLLALIDDSAWRAAQIRHDPSQSAYLEDIAQAWALAAELDAKDLRQGRVPALLRREIDCALLTAQLHSVAGAVAPELLVRLIQSGIWTSHATVAAVRLNPDPKDRVAAFAALAPHLPDAQRQAALGNALEAAAAITYPSAREGARLARASPARRPAARRLARRPGRRRRHHRTRGPSRADAHVARGAGTGRPASRCSARRLRSCPRYTCLSDPRRGAS